MVSYCCNRIKRKEKKYNRQIRVMKATPATVCDVYHYKNKDKTCNLRIDSLAQILSLGNICSGKAIGTIVFMSRRYKPFQCRHAGTSNREHHWSSHGVNCIQDAR
jgi:hypothetical protein